MVKKFSDRFRSKHEDFAQHTDNANNTAQRESGETITDENSSESSGKVFEDMTHEERLLELKKQQDEITALKISITNLSKQQKEESDALRITQSDLLREKADNINFTTRLKKQIDDAGKYAISSFAKDMTEVLENLYRAKSACDKTEESGNGITNIVEGINLTINSMTNTLLKYGVARIWPMEEKLNPAYHEVISCVQNAEKENGTVVDVVKAGYEVHGRVIIPSLVVVVQN